MNRHNRAPVFTLKPRPLSRVIAGLGAMSMALPVLAIDEHTLPQHGVVTSGNAAISQHGSNMGIRQTSSRAVIDWQSFDIGAEASVNFQQPDAASIAVNRINGSADPSEIHGSLQANGQVWLMNPNGIMFGDTAQVDVAGLLATSARLNADAFMAGDTRLEFTDGERGSIVNAGDISIKEGGLAAFVAPSVQNSGRIHARLGRVTLAAGDTFTLDLAGDGLLELGLTAGEQARVEQLGEVVAAGGIVEISTADAGATVNDVINLSGYTSAASAEVVGGEIILSGGDVQIAGTVDASGTGAGGRIDIRAERITTTDSASLKADAFDNGDGGRIYAYADIHGDYAGSFSAHGGAGSGNGGFVETSGTSVSLDAALSVNTNAPNGNSGTWLIDPIEFVVDAGAATAIVNNLDAGNVDIEAEDAITVDAAIDASAQTNSHTLAFLDENNDSNLSINLNAAISLGANQSLSGEGTTVNVSNNAPIQNGIDVAAGEADINVAAGTYDGSININKDGLQLNASGAVVQTTSTGRGFTINADDVGISGFTIDGALNVPYYDKTNWDTGATAEDRLSGNHGIFVNGAFTGFSITGNTITNVRSAVSTGVGAGGTIGGNTIDNTKGSVLAQDDGSLLSISGNMVGSTGNEWDIVLNLSNIDAVTAADASRQTAILSFSEANNGMSVLDRGYGSNNRTHIAVDAASTSTDADDFGLGNGLGNQRQALQTITDGIAATVSGGVINVGAGTYTEALEITRNIEIIGAGAEQTIILPDTLIETGVGHKYTADMKATVFVSGADDVTLRGMTIDGNNLDGNAVVFWTNASGTLEDLIIKNPRPFSGMQTGQGLAVDATGSNTTDLQVANVSFENWNKNAIDVVNGQGAGSGGGNVNLTVLDSTFNGRGPTNTIAQNAIVLWERAGGTITAVIDGAAINNIEYIDDPTWSASGILLYGSANGQLTIRNSSFSNTVHAIGVAGESPNEVDATVGNVFNGVAVADASLDELFDIENLLRHKTDDADNGLIRLVQDNVFVTHEKGSIQAGIDAAASGDTVRVETGSYAETLLVNNTDNLTVQGQDGALIDASGISLPGSKRIVDLRADGTTFSGFDILGPGADAGVSVGISISGQDSTVTGNTVSEVLTGIQTTTMHGTGNGLIGGNTINADYGISLQNSDNTLTGNTVNAAVEGVGLLDGNNSFSGNTFTLVAGADGLALYGGASTANLLATANTVNIQEDTHLPGAIDLAGAGGFLNLANGIYNLGSSLNIDQSLTLSGESQAGTVINAATNGYGFYVTADDVSLSDFTLNGPSADAGSSYGIKVSPGGSASSRLSNFSIANVTIQGSGRAELDLNGVVGADITNVTADGQGTAGAGIQITDSADITLTGVTTSDNLWGGVALYQSNRFYNQQTTNINIDANDNTFNEVNGLFTQDSSDGTSASVVGGDGLDFGVMNLSGFSHIVENSAFRNGENGHPADGTGGQFTFFRTSLADAFAFAVNLNDTAVASSTVQGWTGSGTDSNFYVGTHENMAMSIQAAFDAADDGAGINVFAGTYTETSNTDKQLHLIGDTVIVDGLSLNGGGSISGSFSSSQEGFSFGSPLSLSDDLSLTTIGTATISAAEINGTSPQAQSLTIEAEGSVALASLGADIALGTTVISSGDAMLNGDTYRADSLEFSGPVTLTAPQTLFDTSSSNGNIGFSDDIFGSENAAQSLTFSAGDGSPDSGDVSLENVGTEDIKLADMSVTANNFSAATLWLAGDFSSQLSGDQTFSSQTLNADGNVTSNVGGNSSGPIKSLGNISLDSVGSVSGDISGGSVAVSSSSGSVDANVSAATGTARVSASGNINGSITGSSVEANSSTGSIAANVNALSGNASVAAAQSISGNISGANVAVSGRNIVSNINATGNASISAVESYSGSVSADATSIKADNVNATLSGGSAVVDANTGSVNGDVENLDLGNSNGDGLQVDVPSYTPPVNEPPVDEPPVNEPPVNEPPVNEPPVNEPPVNEPPVDEPPVNEPPVNEPPVDEPPVDEESFNRDEANFQQLYAESFGQPDSEAGLTETPASGPFVIASVDNIAEALGDGNTAIIIDLSPGYEEEEE